MTKFIALMFAAGLLLLVAGCRTPQATQWEYRKVYGINQVNQAAADGWLVVGFSVFINTESSTVPHSQTDVYLLKRPKPEELRSVPGR